MRDENFKNLIVELYTPLALIAPFQAKLMLIYMAGQPLSTPKNTQPLYLD